MRTRGAAPPLPGSLGGPALPPLPDGGDYDCGDFDTRAEANAVRDRTAGDPHNLDADGDGEACESLPEFGVTPAALPVSP